jgi:hypothetical protein
MIEECLELTFGRSGGKETARSTKLAWTVKPIWAEAKWPFAC